MQENNEKNIAKIEKIKQELESGFFGFWTKYLRVSILVLILLIVWGIFSLYMIPKESSPKVDIWYISITTIYQWVSPMDIDTLITDKIEKQIKDIDGIKKITSTSSVWVSNTVVEVKTWYKSKDVMSDIKSEVDKVSLPSSVEKPTVTEITNSSELLYFVYVFWDEKKFSKFDYIFDCSTDNDLMYLTGKLNLTSTIFNLSITNHAKVLVCGISPYHYRFVRHQFDNILENDTLDLYNPIGCWNPTFKASYNDIAIMVQLSLKTINLMIQENNYQHFTIQYDDNLNLKVERF